MRNLQILLFSSFAEKTVNDVVDAILNTEIEVIRFSERSEPISFVNFLSKFPKDSKIISFWYRKGIFNSDSNFPSNKIQAYCDQEYLVAVSFFLVKLERKPHLGNYFQRIPNKLIHLSIAHESGLVIPETLITTKKNEVIDFKKKHQTIINKSLRDSFKGTFDNIYYYNHTERVTTKHIESIDETFFPTLFQEEIPKAYELRVIFVQEKIWAGAIFSQSDPKTSLDWRNYNHEKPNRIVPYQLPARIEKNIRVFVKKAQLNTGAIDMIVTKDKRYVFLECNPNGQISMVSEKCNYPIEKYIADYLTNV